MVKTTNGDETPAQDMEYRFIWDSEPTDEQLQTLMLEVSDCLRREADEIQTRMQERLHQVYLRARAEFPRLSGK